MSKPHTFYLNERGQFLTSWSETDFVHLPARIVSCAGWCLDVSTPEELESALRRHHGEDGVDFDFDAVLAWALDLSETHTSGYIRPVSKHNTVGIADEGFLIY